MAKALFSVGDKFTNQSGKVSIEVTQVDSDGRVHCTFVEPSGRYTGSFTEADADKARDLGGWVATS